MKTTAAINVAWKARGLDEDTARDLYERVTGKRRLTLMDSSELHAVLVAINATPVAARNKGLTGPYAKKLQALWIAGWNLGIVRDRTDAAMLAFIKRQTGIEHTAFLRDAADARKAVEALKSWLTRAGGVSWGSSNGRDYLQHDQGKIAWAQWREIDPAASLAVYGGDYSFHQEVRGIVGAGFTTIGSLKPADWRLVMNTLGERLRAKDGA